MLKPGVKLNGIKPEICIAIMIANNVYLSNGYTFTLTSICDGKHGRASLHYPGLAFDCRTRDLPSESEKKNIADQIRNALGEEFDVILHSTHIHVEFQPK